MYLLDTNVLSELRKPTARASTAVVNWVSARRATDLYLSAVTVLEIELGIARLERRDAARASRIQSWLTEDVLDSFAHRILSIGVLVARRAARLHVPDPRPERDAYIAATDAVHGLTVVTRNVSDFAQMGIELVNPWATS
jgi:predicted nucleic acid-binding protein